MLTRLLHSLGPAKGTGFGLAGVSWTELRSWAIMTGLAINPWQADALHAMSAGYAGEFNRAGNVQHGPPPWEPPARQEVRKNKVADALRAGFRGMMGKKSDD